MYKIKQNVNCGFNLLISFALSGILQVAALSQAQAKLSPGDSLVERMKKGEVQEQVLQSQSLETKVVSKAILNNEEGQPLCVVDIRENPDLSPQFASPAPPDFNSSLSVDLRPCDLSEMGFIHHVAQNSVLGPTKAAVAPLVALGGWALLSCVYATAAGAGLVGLAAGTADADADVAAVGFATVVAGILGNATALGLAAVVSAMSGIVAVSVASIACFGGTLYFLLEDEDEHEHEDQLEPGREVEGKGHLRVSNSGGH